MLVFAADLEEVEEIGCGGVDGDEVLVFEGGWIGEGGYGEILWSLGWEELLIVVIVKEMEGVTLTYSLI